MNTSSGLRIIFVAALCGLAASVAVHIAVLAGAAAEHWPFSPFILHVLAILVFGAAIVMYFVNYKEIPPEHRHNAMLFVFKQRPWWFSVLLVVLILYAAGNFLAFMGNGPPLRAFSGHWIAFFAAAAFFSYPAKPELSVSRTEGPVVLPDTFRMPFMSLFARLMMGTAKIMYGWLFILVAAFAALAIATGEWGFLFPSVFFATGIAANMIYQLRYTKILITSASITREAVTGELYRYHTLERFHLPLANLKVELKEYVIRGNSLFELKFLDTAGRPLLSQYAAGGWSYVQLKQMHDRIVSALADG